MKESEIRPKHLFNEYLKLSREDADLLEKKDFSLLSTCPACESTMINKKFNKYGFIYDECSECGSFFCNPRPTCEQLDWFYANSRSSNYWSEVFIPYVEDVRRQKIYKPKAEKLQRLIKENDVELSSMCDCGAGNGIFLDELKLLLPDITYSAIEPNKNAFQILEQKRYDVLNVKIEESNEWKNSFDFVVSLEVFEHVQSPIKFIQGIFDLIKLGGYCLITTLGCEGFDIQVLGKKSKSISTPHHLNFFSLEGFKRLFNRVGFKTVDITTPGLLDIDIVLNSDYCPDFLTVLAKRGNETLEDLQKLLIKHKLSSHVWIFARKQ